MIVVRNVFTAKPGCASKLAAIFKEASALVTDRNSRVLTDHIGDFNTVVFEYEGQSLADFEAMMADYANNPAFREKMSGYTDLYITGRREIYRVA